MTRINGVTNGVSAESDSTLRALLHELTLEEKISMLAAKNVWETADVERLGIPSLKVSVGRIRHTKYTNLPITRSLTVPTEHAEENSLTVRQRHVFLLVCLLLLRSIEISLVKSAERWVKKQSPKELTLCWGQQCVAIGHL